MYRIQHRCINWIASVKDVKIQIKPRTANLHNSSDPLSRDVHNVNRQYLEREAKRLGIKEHSDWYNVPIKQLNPILLHKYYKTPINLFSTLYPEHDWLAWKFDICPDSFWNSPDNQKKFVDWLAKELNINKPTDWYDVIPKQIIDRGAGTLLSKYRGSVVNLISKIYPNYDWLPWRFETAPECIWEDVDNHVRFIQWAGNELGIKDIKEWYGVSKEKIAELGGEGLLAYYKGSLYKLMSSVYTEYEWLPWKFPTCPDNWWKSMANQKWFMDHTGKELGIKEMKDWYQITVQQYCEAGGTTLIMYKYYRSPLLLLSATYPEYEWLPWKFSTVPRNFWSHKEHVKEFLDWASKKFGVEDFFDWSKVSTKDVYDLIGPEEYTESRLSLHQLLQIAYPDYYPLKKSNLNLKMQNLLKGMLKTIFPNEEMLEYYRKTDITTISGIPLELDFYYPKLKLAIEFQGQQNYLSSTLNSNDVVQIDSYKSKLCKENGITLVEVPYWWDRMIETFEATLYSQRPDLFLEPPKHGYPIPMTPPASLAFLNTKNVTRVPLMTATEWDLDTMEPTGWIMTEKYDGMRLYWNGSDFYSRQGNKVKVPDFISSQMPKETLDGELWMNYGSNKEVVDVGMKGEDDKWKKAVFWVFDAPKLKTQSFIERFQFLKQINFPSFVKLVEIIECKSKEHLNEYFSSILAKGGEGVMLRDPQSLYTVGRSPSLRKLKPFFDTEVKVVENNYPHGFNCEQMDGKAVFVGLDDNYEEANKVKEGSVITVKHQGKNVYGMLQYPKFYHERTDVKWEEIKI